MQCSRRSQNLTVTNSRPRYTYILTSPPPTCFFTADMTSTIRQPQEQPSEKSAEILNHSSSHLTELNEAI